ncbi:MAG: MBL fold metallo-hydrolase [Candidatus Vogelbacteria bacterium]|nr:MBL fold metallo-hydrolase [Candidatus Vogelbacteria bacterium]
MVLSYHKRATVKVAQGDFVLAFNPISRNSDAKPSKFGADIVFVSMDHPDANGVENATYGDRAPFVIDGPGEYEVSGVFVKGIPTVVGDAAGAQTNTVFVARLDDISLCHLGFLRSKDEITAAVREQIGQVDVVFILIAGPDALPPADAHKVATMLEPTYIVPLYDGNEDALKKFLKAEGVVESETVEKLTIKKKDVGSGTGIISVLKPQ